MDTPPERDNASDSARDPEAERAARLAALRNLSAAPGSPPPPLPEDGTPRREPLPPPPLSQRPSRRPLALIIGLVVVALLVALTAGLLIHARQPQPTSSTHPPESLATQITPRSDGLDCPVDIAWSPDGARIAVLGYSGRCPDWPPTVGSTPGMLIIYSASTGALLQREMLDQFVLGLGGVVLGAKTDYLAYQTVMWSSDGARLALPFFAQHGFLAAPSPFSLGPPDPTVAPRPTLAGVLLLDATTMQDVGLVTAPYTASVSSTAPLEWNLITLQLIQPALQLPPALGYHWGAGGALLPDDILSAGQRPAPAPRGPVGNPSGDHSFTIWQPGMIAQGYTPTSNGVGAAVPGLDLFYTRFGAWSPDGAYLLAPAYYGGRIDTFQPPQPSAAQVQSAGRANEPLLPTHDAALTALYSGAHLLDMVSWSPDGQRLAVWNGGEGGEQVPVYSATSGRIVTTLHAPAAADAQLDGSPSNVGEVMRWSSDGKHLALMSLELNSLVVWTLT